MARFEYEKNSKVPPHRHSHEQVTTVLSGEQRISIWNSEMKEEFIVKSGDSYIVPANFEHVQVSLKATITIDAWGVAL